MAIKTSPSATGYGVHVLYEPMLCHLEQEIMYQIAKQVADKFLIDHYQEIAEKISQEAIATLSVAEAGAKIRETLEKKIPDKILEVVSEKTKIFQRGIFGGMTRIG